MNQELNECHADETNLVPRASPVFSTRHVQHMLEHMVYLLMIQKKIFFTHKYFPFHDTHTDTQRGYMESDPSRSGVFPENYVKEIPSSSPP